MTALPVTDAQWAALDLVVTRGEGSAGTYIVEGTPHGDAAITTKTADALARRGFVTIVRGRAWPTTAGARALASHRRITAKREASTTTAQG